MTPDRLIFVGALFCIGVVCVTLGIMILAAG